MSAAILDHGIPCLGFAIKEQFHVNILKNGLKKLGLEPGPWLADFKQALYSQSDPESKFELQPGSAQKARHFRLGELAAEIALMTPGLKITYITDVAYNQSNADKIVALAKNSDYLFIEAINRWTGRNAGGQGRGETIFSVSFFPQIHGRSGSFEGRGASGIPGTDGR